MSEVTHTFDALAARLIGIASRLGEARAVEAQLVRTDRARRWRRASLLWPLFTKD